jgi:hypothetical protein
MNTDIYINGKWYGKGAGCIKDDGTIHLTIERAVVEKTYTASSLGNPFNGGVSMSIDHLKSRVCLLDEELVKIEALEVNQTAHFMGNLRITRSH